MTSPKNKIFIKRLSYSKQSCRFVAYLKLFVTQKSLQQTRYGPYSSQMTEIRFYHLTKSTLNQALPDLLERTLSRGWRAFVLGESEEQVEKLDEHLWSYRPDAFLPHGRGGDGLADQHPVLLATADDDTKGADVLFLLDEAQSARLSDYALVCVLFDGNDSDRVRSARERWAAYKQEGHDLAYWQQGEKGWTKNGG
jgi:DNA polymerase-3 subunit chi